MTHTTPTQRQFAADYFGLLVRSDFDSAFALLDPQLQNDQAWVAFQGVGNLLRSAHLDSTHFIGVNASSVHTPDGAWHTLNLSYEMPTRAGQWLIANVATRTASGRVTVIGFSASPQAQSLESANRFTLKGKSSLHLVWLGCAVIMLIIPLATMIVVIRTKGMPRRWLWAPASLIGTPAFMMNWTTGAVTLRQNFFLLFGAGAAHPGPAAPWIVSFAVPVGAAIALWKVRGWRLTRAKAEDVAA